jgi:transposase InsO family protein
MILKLIAEAQAQGARLKPACEVLGISSRAVERWRRAPGGDDERRGPRHRPRNALTPAEEAQVLTVVTSARYSGVSPKKLVPELADEGLYIASESTIYRLQHRHGLRGKKSQGPRLGARASVMHRATGPNQVWSWDITWLPTTVRGRYFFLYLAIDVWSRRIVGWAVELRETAEAASAFITEACQDEGIDRTGLVLHSDNGNPMRGSSMLATLQALGVVASFSRPHVSDDNAYSESLFRTLKHSPAYPHLFADVATARAWTARFVDWYNGEHRHSGIRFVTPNERHYGQEHEVLARRRTVYELARRANPERWARTTRNWSRIETVTLNPEREPKAAA